MDAFVFTRMVRQFFLDCNGNEIISGEDENGRLESAHSFWDEEIGVGIKYTRENSEEQEKIGFFTLDGKNIASLCL